MPQRFLKIDHIGIGRWRLTIDGIPCELSSAQLFDARQLSDVLLAHPATEHEDPGDLNWLRELILYSLAKRYQMTPHQYLQQWIDELSPSKRKE